MHPSSGHENKALAVSSQLLSPTSFADSAFLDREAGFFNAPFAVSGARKGFKTFIPVTCCVDFRGRAFFRDPAPTPNARHPLDTTRLVLEII